MYQMWLPAIYRVKINPNLDRFFVLYNINKQTKREKRDIVITAKFKKNF